MPAACATAIATGTIMFADAVFDAASDITMATAVKRIVSDERRAHRQPGRDAATDRLGEAGRKRQRPHRQAAAEQQDDAPVDADRLFPAQREPPRAPVDGQHEQQNRADHRRHRLRHGRLVRLARMRCRRARRWRARPGTARARRSRRTPRACCAGPSRSGRASATRPGCARPAPDRLSALAAAATGNRSTRNPKSSTASGTPSSIHWKKEICSWAMRSSMPLPMRFGGVPIGVPMPPIDAPNAAISIIAVAKLRLATLGLAALGQVRDDRQPDRKHHRGRRGVADPHRDAGRDRRRTRAGSGWGCRQRRATTARRTRSGDRGRG